MVRLDRSVTMPRPFGLGGDAAEPAAYEAAPPTRSEMEDVQEARRSAQQRVKRKGGAPSLGSPIETTEGCDGSEPLADGKRAKRVPTTLPPPMTRQGKRGGDARRAEDDAALAAAVPGQKRAARRRSLAAATDEAVALESDDTDSGADMEVRAETDPGVAEELSRAIAREREMFARERHALQLQAYQQSQEATYHRTVAEEAHDQAKRYKQQLVEYTLDGKRTSGERALAGTAASTPAAKRAAPSIATKDTTRGTTETTKTAETQRVPASSGVLCLFLMTTSVFVRVGCRMSTIVFMSLHIIMSHTPLPVSSLLLLRSGTRRRRPLKSHVTDAITARNASMLQHVSFTHCLCLSSISISPPPGFACTIGLSLPQLSFFFCAPLLLISASLLFAPRLQLPAPLVTAFLFEALHGHFHIVKSQGKPKTKGDNGRGPTSSQARTALPNQRTSLLIVLLMY